MTIDRDDVTLIDGGTGQELLARADADPTPLWSAQVMIDQPELVVEVHRAYLDVGAEVVTANAYSATRERLEPYGIDGDYERLQRMAAELAAEAVRPYDGARAAGCLSPYRWTYRPELALPFDELWPAYAESAALQAPDVDLIICETMGSIDEARAAVVGAATTGLPVWVSWTVRDDDSACLRSGEPVTEALEAAARWHETGDAAVEAVLVNCSTVEAVSASVDALVGGPMRVGAYANGFRHIADDYQTGSVTTELGRRDDADPDRYAAAVERWIERGATIVGGCCEIGPDHIAAIAGRLGRLVS